VTYVQQIDRAQSLAKDCRCNSQVEVAGSAEVDVEAQWVLDMKPILIDSVKLKRWFSDTCESADFELFGQKFANVCQNKDNKTMLALKAQFEVASTCSECAIISADLTWLPALHGHDAGLQTSPAAVLSCMVCPMCMCARVKTPH
jgi:hypothetical protein